MNTKSSPSRYRYCICRLSTLATSTFMPALNVRSTTLPDSTFFSLVRTKAPPLPGLTCWNSTTFQSWPSMFSVIPFFRSFVVATSGLSWMLCLNAFAWMLCLDAVPSAPAGLQREQFPGGRGEQASAPGVPGGCLAAGHEDVLDADAAPARQVHAWLAGARDPGSASTPAAR